MDTSVATGVQVLYAYSDTLQGLSLGSSPSCWDPTAAT